MKLYDEISKLNFLELNILLGHLRLGVDHLKKYLTQQQLKQLLNVEPLDHEQHQKIKSDNTERRGNFILVLNTIFTCVLGSWLGVSGYMGIGLGFSRILLIIIVLVAAVASGYLGYMSIKQTQNQARDVVTKQQIYNLQLKILELMNERREKEIDKINDHLDEKIYELNEFIEISKTENNADKTKNNNFKSTEAILNWLNNFSDNLSQKIKNIPREEVSVKCFNLLMKIKIKLKHALTRTIPIISQSDEDEQKKSLPAAANNNKSFISALTDPTENLPKLKVKPKSWLKTNMRSLLLGLIPTVLGGFGSLFIYFDGFPNIAKAFDIVSLEKFLKDPQIKIIVLISAVILTLYFAYSFVYANRKSFQREQEFEKTQKHIANQEALLVEKNTKLNMLRKVKNHLENFFQIYEILHALLKTESSARRASSKLHTHL